MKERMIPATCPHCGHSFYIKRDTLVITDIQPIAVKRILDRTYFSHLCSNCHKLFYLVYPFMIRNPNKHYSLILSDKENFEDIVSDEKMIVTKNVSQFYLAFNLLENDLDFELILRKKRALEKKLNDVVWFESYDKQNHCLWFECQKELKAVLLSSNEENVIINK